MKGMRVSLIGTVVAAALCALPACRHSGGEPVAQAAIQQAPASRPAARPALNPKALSKVEIDNLRIERAQALVDRDASDARAWVALGNAYFDAARMEDAVKAYDKALSIKPDMPEVLTDQGIMYREMGQTDKAIASFKKAAELNPRHLPSILDLGVLYAQDRNDNAHALEAWNRVIKLGPGSDEALRAQWYIDQLNHSPKAQ